MKSKRPVIIIATIAILIMLSACPIINRPPREPKLISPTNGSEIQGTAATLQWSCEEPDGDYPLRYDIYLGENANLLTKINSQYNIASYTVNALEMGVTYYWRVIAYDNKGSSRNGPVWSFKTKDLLISPMIFVEKGSFTMGDTWGDGGSNEKPTHKVTFTYDFYIGKYETTFNEYDAFCEATGRSKPDDWGWGRGQRPVIEVSWWDAIAYCNWLSEESGLPVAYRIEGEVNEGQMLDANGNVTTDITKVLGYRLPTEAEWEYAARGGKHNSPYKYSGSDNVGDVAWYWRNSGDKYLTGDWDWDTIMENNCRTHEVGLKLSNALGIYDMSGNVWEWCSDWWSDYTETPKTNPYNNSGSSQIGRGGGFYELATYVRVAYRGGAPTGTSFSGGFRICRTVP